MSDTNSWPPPPPPPQFSNPPKRNVGCLISIAGILFAFAPILIVAIGSLFTSENVLDESTSGLAVLMWYTIFTFPVGGITSLVGLIIWTSTRQRKR